MALLASDDERLLAAPVPLETFVLLARRRDPVVHAASANVGGPARMVYVLGEETPWGAWVDCVQRVTAALREEGHEISGFDVLVRSAVPIGGGLASGSALSVAILRALRQAFTLSLTDDALARLAVRIRQSPIAIATVFAQEHAAILVEGEQHEVIALPADLELRVLSERSVPADPIALDALLSALRAGDSERLVALFDARAAHERDRSDLLAARRTLALAKRASPQAA